MTSGKANTTAYLDGVLISAVAIGGTVLLTQMQFTPISPNDAVAVVFPPWTGGGRTVAAAVNAGASILRLGRFPFIAIVRPGDAKYPERVIAEGAMFVLDAKDFSGCLARAGSRP